MDHPGGQIRDTLYSSLGDIDANQIIKKKLYQAYHINPNIERSPNHSDFVKKLNSVMIVDQERGLLNDIKNELLHYVEYNDNIIKTSYVRTFLIILLSFTSYILSMIYRSYITLMISSILFTLYGLCIQHTANHGCLFDGRSSRSSKQLNDILGYTNDIIGASSYVWKIHHNIEHHLESNSNKDPDSVNNPLIRFNSEISRNIFHTFQHIYIFIIIPLMYFGIQIADFKTFIFKKYFHVKLEKIPSEEYKPFFIGKIIHYMLAFVIPYLFFRSYISAVIFPLVGSAWLGYQFIVSHNTLRIYNNMELIKKITKNNDIFNDGSLDYLIHQVVTSSNWGTKSRLLCLLTGGLNHQIIHHITPGINDQNYPTLTRKTKKYVLEEIKKWLEKYNDKTDPNMFYVEYDNYWDNLKDCYRYFKYIGNNDI